MRKNNKITIVDAELYNNALFFLGLYQIPRSETSVPIVVPDENSPVGVALTEILNKLVLASKETNV